MITCTSRSGGNWASTRSRNFQKFLMAMTTMTLPDHLPRRDVQSREQGCRAVADVVMGLPGREARAHRQERPGAVQGLHLAFFVHRQDHWRDPTDRNPARRWP